MTIMTMTIMTRPMDGSAANVQIISRLIYAGEVCRGRDVCTRGRFRDQKGVFLAHFSRHFCADFSHFSVRFLRHGSLFFVFRSKEPRAARIFASGRKNWLGRRKIWVGGMIYVRRKKDFSRREKTFSFLLRARWRRKKRLFLFACKSRG